MFGTEFEANGFYRQLIDAVFHHLKRPVKLSAKPWKRAIAELDLGMAGVGGIFDKLTHGRLDAVLAIEQVGIHLMQSARYTGIEKSPVYLVQNPTHLAFNKSLHAAALLNDSNHALGELRKNGDYARFADAIGNQDK